MNNVFKASKFSVAHPALLTLATWFFFSLLLSLIPIVMDYWTQNSSHSETEQGNLKHIVIRNGELLLISMGVLGGALGALAKTNNLTPIYRVIWFGSSFLLAIFCIGTYTQIDLTDMSPAYVYETSLHIFIGSLILSVSSIVVIGKSN